MTPWKAFKAMYRGICGCHYDLEVAVAVDQRCFQKLKGNPAQQKTVLSNMPIALVLRNRMAYPIPTSTKLLRCLNFHYLKVQNKLRSSR